MKHSIEHLEVSIKEAQQRLRDFRLHRSVAATDFETREEALSCKLDEARRKFYVFQSKNTRRLHEYTSAIRQLRGDRIPKALLSMEAQLCQYLHQMYMGEQQLKISERATQDILKRYEEGHNEVLRGKQDAERQLMKTIVELDEEKKHMEEEYKMKVEAQQELIEVIERELHESGHLDYVPEWLKKEEEEREKRIVDSAPRPSFLRAATHRLAQSARNVTGEYTDRTKSSSTPPPRALDRNSGLFSSSRFMFSKRNLDRQVTDEDDKSCSSSVQVTLDRPSLSHRRTVADVA